MKNLIEITPKTFDVDLEILYATSENFTRKPVYTQPRCFLHFTAVGHLKEAMEIAKELGYRFKIWDGYRPPSVQQLFWDFCPDPTFISDPSKGGPHNRGIAVDLTLLDKKTGQELDMGTPFDDFSPKAYHKTRDISDKAKRNRMILLGIMTAAGWDWFKNEWWHYQLFNPKQYPVIDENILGFQLTNHAA
ncbi:MAG: D-alanyl-D-alanine dipeptidase [bacterium]|nr:D-alanyl-D-alanine dipeptidase [bacterium]